jgi:hypothetical protein
MMAELKRIRRKISLEMIAARKKGRLSEYMREMHREAQAVMREAAAVTKRRRRKRA